MDIFNEKKIAELERIIKSKEKELEEFRKERADRENGKHKTGPWCEGCKHSVSHDSNGFFVTYKSRSCLLDSECKDREGK